jgi:FKBP-type peptidyl-prolyl cis-trans isomerase FklB
MKRIVPFLLISLSLVLIVACTNAPGTTGSAKVVDHKDSLSYAIGAKMGTDLSGQGVEINQALFNKGVADGVKGEFMFNDTVIGIILNNFQYEMNLKFEEEMANMLERNKQEGAKFLAENRSREGVVALPGGLQYKIIKEGAGPNPSPTDSVRIHYRAMFIDGTTFDQSYDRGITGIRLSNVIQGLAEGLQLMKPGAVFELYIPPELGYGDQDFANIIPGGSTLVYRVELLEITR